MRVLTALDGLEGLDGSAVAERHLAIFREVLAVR